MNQIPKIEHGQKLKIVSMTLHIDTVELVVVDAGGFGTAFGVSVEYARQFSVGDDVLIELLPRPAK